MMESAGKLNQSLYKGLFWLRTINPDALPIFMCEKKFLIAVTAQSVGERSGTPVKFHRVSP
jgi:hypothetical protein